jgi:hypothetical protein
MHLQFVDSPYYADRHVMDWPNVEEEDTGTNRKRTSSAPVLARSAGG